MAINKNHEFEEINGVKCAIVEKNITKQRAIFLQEILIQNKYEVYISPDLNSTNEDEKYTLGVSNLLFNATNAIFGRLLKTNDNSVITLPYWKQETTEINDDKPYYQK